MQLYQLNEKSFLKEVVSKYATTAEVSQFDDCVVIDLEEVCGIQGLPYFVYSIDHPSFVRRGMDAETDHRFYGRWVAAIVCGDVLAMGAQPRGFSLDLAAPLEMESNEIEWILMGIKDVLDHYDTAYEGGNIDISPLETVGFAWGVVDKDLIIRRSGASVGDYITVTGILGFGWADWTIRKLGKFDKLSTGTQNAFRNYKLEPFAPCKAIIESTKTGGITSGMDLSDGPVEFYHTILERSGHGVLLDPSKFPITTEMKEAAAILDVRPELLALDAGYDTPLTHGWTVSPDAWPEIQEIFQENNSQIYRIGQVTDTPQVVLKTDNGLKQIKPFWDDQFQKTSVIDRWYDTIRSL